MAYKLWFDSTQLLKKYPCCQSFYNKLDGQIGRLTFVTPLRDLVFYGTHVIPSCSHLCGNVPSEEIGPLSENDYIKRANKQQKNAKRENKKIMKASKHLCGILYSICAGNLMITNQASNKTKVLTYFKNVLKSLLQVQCSFSARPLCPFPGTKEHICYHATTVILLRFESYLCLKLVVLQAPEEIDENGSFLREKDGFTTLSTSLYRPIYKQMKVLQDLNIARQRWKQADALALRECSQFFDEFNTKFGPLTMTCAFDHFKNYLEFAIQKLKTSSQNLRTPY